LPAGAGKSADCVTGGPGWFPSAFLVAPFHLLEFAVSLLRAFEHFGRTHGIVEAAYQAEQNAHEDHARVSDE
jgi:hypothetical protein